LNRESPHWSTFGSYHFERIPVCALEATLRQIAGLILMYHRIVSLECDPWGLSVSPRHFAQQLESLRSFGQPRSLTQALDAYRRRDFSKRSLVITFDDGYVDNLWNAAPLIERYEIPATIFVASSYIGCRGEFWWDELERILLRPKRLPGELRLNTKGSLQVWALGAACEYTEEERSADLAWSVNKQSRPSKRCELYQAVHRALQPLDDNERLIALDHLKAWSGDTGIARTSHLCVSPDEANALNKVDLIEIGAHTSTHRALPNVSEDVQRREIRQSKAELERLLGTPVVNFAYPYGQFTQRIATIVREEKFVSACSTRPSPFYEDADLFALPRLKVGDWDAPTFEAMLGQVLSNGRNSGAKSS
jgi:peptidoglycan/xylan/chitin deacetylase (PgdA/CDA1 family)